MRPDERHRVLATLTAAFREDPQVRWWFPDDDSFDASAQHFFGALLDMRAEGGEVWVAGGGDAVAMWTPPGGNLLGPEGADAHYAAMALHLPAQAVRRIDRLDEGVAALLPDEPHWYLGVLATSPQRRGEGLATGVLSPVLGNADRGGFPVALETGGWSNIAFYGRFGFEVVGEAGIEDAPPVWVLHRSPR